MNFRTVVRQSSLLLPLSLLLSVTTTSYASSSGVDESLITPEAIHQLEQRALTASPRDQCFLYTELVHSMTELAGKQMLAGDTDNATATLKRIDHYAHLIHVALAANDKRLKNAEMIMHHTVQRLTDYMHAASYEDQATLKSTLKQLDQVHSEILTQVFAPGS
jgi:hypothetical protein